MGRRRQRRNNSHCWLQAPVLGPDYQPLTEAEAKERRRWQFQDAAAQASFVFFFSFYTTNKIL
jgi:hypothetical protein